MPNFLDNFGLESFNEDEDSLMGLLGHVVKEGKGINGYYGIPYLNTHLGDVQVIARIKRNDEGNYECCGFDTHCKGRSVWDVRIVDELNPLDDDPLCKVIVIRPSDKPYRFVDQIRNDQDVDDVGDPHRSDQVERALECSSQCFHTGNLFVRITNFPFVSLYYIASAAKRQMKTAGKLYNFY